LDVPWQDHPALARALKDYPEALCLDGSPGLYYLRRGSGGGLSRYLIFFEGGGFCSSHEDCADRAGGYYGSTRGDGATRDLDHPFFTTSSTVSPLLWNWNHVFVRYCDGGYFSGSKQDPQRVGRASVFYRGRQITAAVFSDLARHSGLGSATDVVLSGCSAGGIRTFAHADALRIMVPSLQSKVVGLADSGFYLDRPIFTPLKRFVVVGQNATGLLNTRCLADNTDAEERCLVGAVVAPYLSTPIFAWQSRYDEDQRGCEMSSSCAASVACVRAYGDDLAEQVNRELLAGGRHGVFLDSCNRHCAGPSLPLDDASKLNPLQAFAVWHAGGPGVYGQAALYPCGSCCGSWAAYS